MAGVQINLPTSGFIRPVGLTAAQNEGVLQSNPDPNTVIAYTGDSDGTITLPSPNAGQDFGGTVIIIKNLSTMATITIGRGINTDPTPVQVKIDGGDDDLIIDTHEQTISLYYINENVGWMTGPAQI